MGGRWGLHSGSTISSVMEEAIESELYNVEMYEAEGRSKGRPPAPNGADAVGSDADAD